MGSSTTGPLELDAGAGLWPDRRRPGKETFNPRFLRERKKKKMKKRKEKEKEKRTGCSLCRRISKLNQRCLA